MTAIIILAAGASSRMGRPKQLLPYQQNNLLQHTIGVAVSTGFSPVIVVLGANANDILLLVQNDNITIVENTDWEEGLGSSIRIGISAVMQQIPSAESALLMLCDQPFVTTALLHQLVEAKGITGKKVIASSYNQTAGVPVLFDKSYFPELLQLKGQDGAKKLLMQYPDDVAAIPFPEGAIDIDTPEDYYTLQSTHHGLPGS